MTAPSQSRIDAYRDALVALLPPGRALTRALGRGIPKLLEACAVEPARVHERTLDLLDEADPSTATELLTEWEDLLGLPDECSSPTTLEGRRAASVGRLVGTGGHSQTDYEALAATLGYSITVTHRAPFRAGRSAAGDALSNDPWAHHVDIQAVPSGPLDAVLACALRRQLRKHGTAFVTFVDDIGALPGDLPMELA